MVRLYDITNFQRPAKVGISYSICKKLGLQIVGFCWGYMESFV